MAFNVLKRRTEGTIRSIKEQLQGLSADDLIAELFVVTDDEIAWELVKKFERQLILATLDFQRFQKELHRFFTVTAKFIRDNHLNRQFFDFSYFIYKVLSERESEKQNILYAYQSLLIQQYSYLVPGKLPYGVTRSGELMVTQELYPFLDYAVYSVEKKMGWKSEVPMTPKITSQIMQEFKRYGYHFKNVMDMKQFCSNEEIITNLIYQMSFLIDDMTEEFFPKPHYYAIHGADIPRQWKETAFYKEKIREHRYFLPAQGVVARLKNAQSISEVLFREKFYNEQVFLLFKIKFQDGTFTSGFYDITEDIFFSVWKHTGGVKRAHEPLENFVLELYTHLVSDVESDVKRLSALKVVSQFEEADNWFEDQPVVQFSVYTDKYVKEENRALRAWDKTKYKTALTEVAQYVRKLPPGAKASRESIEFAKSYGYVIAPGETFVRPFQKTTYHKK